MKGEQHRAEILRLHEAGVAQVEIAERVGLPDWLVWRLLHPDQYAEIMRKTNAKRAEKKRAWERDPANKVKCADCGGPTGSTPGQGDVKRCNDCWAAHEAGRVSERAHRIERWWAEGLTMREICERLGWSQGHLAQEMDRLREAGFELPYRYGLSRPRHKGQVAA